MHRDIYLPKQSLPEGTIAGAHLSLEETARPGSPASVPDNGHELARKIALQRGLKRDPEDTVSGGFNQKSKPGR